MSYYPTMDEDLKRAREILERGKANNTQMVDELVSPGASDKIKQAFLEAAGGTIYGADIYAAYKLIESFVAEIERFQAVEHKLGEAAFALGQQWMEAHARASLEICVCAALRLPNGRVFRGHRHDNAINTAGAAGASRQDIADSVQGFVTTRNRFVDRKEAMALQRAAGYGSAYSPDGELHGDELFSEDLYGNGIDTLIVTKG